MCLIAIGNESILRGFVRNDEIAMAAESIINECVRDQKEGVISGLGESRFV